METTAIFKDFNSVRHENIEKFKEVLKNLFPFENQNLIQETIKELQPGVFSFEKTNDGEKEKRKVCCTFNNHEKPLLEVTFFMYDVLNQFPDEYAEGVETTQGIKFTNFNAGQQKYLKDAIALYFAKGKITFISSYEEKVA